MVWEPIDIDSYLGSLGKHSSFFLQKIREKYLLFLFEAELTSLLVLRVEDKRLFVDGVKKIISRRSIVNLTGNSNCILMLDVEEELFLLQGTLKNMTEPFNMSNADHFLKSDGILSWQTQQYLTGCLSMTGITNAVSFVCQDQVVYSTVYKTNDLGTGLIKVSQNMLTSFSQGGKYFTAKLSGEIVKIIGERIIKSVTLAKEIILVINSSQIFFLFPTSEGQIISQPYQVDFQSDIVINVMSFEKKNWILIVCKSGKLVSLKFDIFTRSFQMRHAWLQNSVATIVGYEDGIIYLLWSDQDKLCLSTLDDDYVLKNIKVFYNMRHVKHFVNIDDNILMIATHGSIYKSKIGVILSQEMQNSTNELMCKMFHNSKVTENLTKEIVEKEHLVEALNILRNDFSNYISITIKEGEITLENKSGYLFRKEMWRMVLERENLQRKHFEMNKLENDIPPGGSISIKYDKKPPHGLILLCDILHKPIGITLQFKCENDHEQNSLASLHEFLKDKCTFVA